MKHATICECPSCQGAPLKRPRYFPRQLITPAEMNLEQAYFRERLRLHNRMLHGWGTVCGALVCPVRDADNEPRPWCVVVKPGYLLGPGGDEIYIDCDVKVDLRKACVSGTTGDPCLETREASFRDPWCSEVYVKCDAGPLFVAVRYHEILARPVPVQPVGCGCDDAACEYSRWCDGYEICVLPECPESHRNAPDLDDLFRGPIPPCPECPDSPWVVLAEVEVDADGVIQRLDNCSCRRLVMSLARGWWQCEDAQEDDGRPRATIEAIEVEGRVVAGSSFAAVVNGGPFPSGARLVPGQDLTVLESAVEPAVIKAKIQVAAAAAPGPRTLTVRDDRGRVLARREKAFEVLDGGGGGREQEGTKRTTRRKRAGGG